MNNEELIQAIRDFFKKTEADQVYLFGSRVRGEEKENSDVDLLVYFPDTVNLLKIVKYKRVLEQIIKYKVDLLTPESVSDKILPIIKKEMKLIYGNI